MCLAIPALIRAIEGYQGEVEIGGVKRVVSLQLVPEAKIGDYVLIHTGYAISVVDEEEAQETLELLAELAGTYPDEIP
ncbi:MAG: HypC/HybG/HupF family hydrogenase formation chaperone [Anaerolineae bacterium]